MAKYVKPKEAAQTLGVNERTLRRWEENGSIEAIRTPSGQRRYNIESYAARAGNNRKVVLYARVSSRAQQRDLNRQVAALSNLYPQAEIVSEIGGGLNFKRKKMLALLGQILSGDVRMVVVAHKDRLARFGFDLFQWLCEQNRCELVVLNETSLSPEREMVEDILAILHCFSSRLYGLRKYIAQVKEDSDLPKP
ncbi:IS607 family transposase [Limnoraphis robusta Tam1]|uniref:DNA invertase n=2 Tax=Limnoraphis robusta TaxID=1118279 RepID=A0A0F5YF48_9CYAN|nr:IS607 family transposase [Limnoraphis robusta]KKD37388.1 DNA invertase [Limnoraphis robusta CS-951]MEA5499954.1 IS607 family transposase [Limnoraphis robusta BA-68 BA1]MEA5520017.1 IS607 family transposase [Limnoraphis robusta CCNP1315]MEA5538386.1 IS607 family transposase [Limnoraphis robusta Tam1]MEA5546105.1 IS607 family transposase [Limnoraphis robusta CCNP1324]